MLQQGKYFSNKDHSEIASRLDEYGEFKPLQVLSPACKEKLALYNQRNPESKIDTFVKAMKAGKPEWIRETILKRVYRAQEKFEKRKVIRQARTL